MAAIDLTDAQAIAAATAPKDRPPVVKPPLPDIDGVALIFRRRGGALTCEVHMTEGGDEIATVAVAEAIPAGAPRTAFLAGLARFVVAGREKLGAV